MFSVWVLRHFSNAYTMTEAHLRWNLVSFDYFVVPNTLIGLLLSFSLCYSRWAARSRHILSVTLLNLFTHSFTSLWFTVTAILKCHSFVNFTSFQTLWAQKKNSSHIVVPLWLLRPLEEERYKCHYSKDNTSLLRVNQIRFTLFISIYSFSAANITFAVNKNYP